MKVLVACRKFDGVIGGVERMSTTLMNDLVAHGYDVELFTWDERNDAKAFYPLAPQIKWTKLAMGSPARKAGMGLILKRLLKVRRFLKSSRPDVVLCFQEGSFVTLKIYGFGLGLPMICAIRESPFRYARIKATPPFWFSCLVMSFAAAITVQIGRYAQAFPEGLQRKIFEIPNHVLPAHAAAHPEKSEGKKVLLSTGRLSPEKNHKVLVEAFGLIAEQFPDWELVIVGRGGQLENLQAIAHSFSPSVAQQIKFPGPSDDVPSWLQAAHLFCLPSWWEGFPNSLAEAMAHGLPVVGFKQCDGVCDLIEDGKTGFLADGLENSQDLAVKLSRLMSDADLRGRMGLAAHDKSRDFDPEKVFDLWDALLRKVSKKS